MKSMGELTELENNIGDSKIGIKQDIFLPIHFFSFVCVCILDGVEGKGGLISGQDELRIVLENHKE